MIVDHIDAYIRAGYGWWDALRYGIRDAINEFRQHNPGFFGW